MTPKHNISPIDLGGAGEFFTCYKSIMEGYQAFPVSNLPYDVVVNANPNLYKIQVKTSTYYGGRPSVVFQLIRRTMNYKKKKCIDVKYKADDFQIYAFVEPLLMKVAFLSTDEITTQYKINIHPDDFDKYTLKRAIQNIKRPL